MRDLQPDFINLMKEMIMSNAMPTAEQVIEMMSAKMGMNNVPAAMLFAKDVAPELVLQVAMSSKESVGDEQSPLDEKTRTLIYLASALATHDDECVKATLASALSIGVNKAELISVIKIVRHAANNGAVGAATPILQALAMKR
jgi:alkylhydroperoxidase/carboxymuconolactone decarboxylase family protein YurZ